MNYYEDEINGAISQVMDLASDAFSGSRFARAKDDLFQALAIGANEKAVFSVIRLDACEDICLTQHALAVRQLGRAMKRVASGEIPDEDAEYLGRLLMEGKGLYQRDADRKTLSDFWKDVSDALDSNSLLDAVFQDTSVFAPSIFTLRLKGQDRAEARFYTASLKKGDWGMPLVAHAEERIEGGVYESFLLAAQGIFPNLKEPRIPRHALIYRPSFDLPVQTMKTGADNMDDPWKLRFKPHFKPAAPRRDFNHPDIIAPGWPNPVNPFAPDAPEDPDEEKSPERRFSPKM